MRLSTHVVHRALLCEEMCLPLVRSIRLFGQQRQWWVPRIRFCGVSQRLPLSYPIHSKLRTDIEELVAMCSLTLEVLCHRGRTNLPSAYVQFKQGSNLMYAGFQISEPAHVPSALFEVL
jgi:hypothetical protein